MYNDLSANCSKHCGIYRQVVFFDLKKNVGWAENLVLIMQLGLSMAGSVVLCFFIGRQIDRWLGTNGVFLIIFTILGVIGGAYLAYRNIMEVLTVDKKGDDSGGR